MIWLMAILKILNRRTASDKKKDWLANLKSDIDKSDIDKFRNVPSNLSKLKSKVDKIDIGKLETTTVDLSKLSNVVKRMPLKRLNIMS